VGKWLVRCAAFLLPCLVAIATAADPPRLTLEMKQANPPAELAEGVRAVLGDDALAVADGGEALATFWLRKELPAEATADQIKNGLTWEEVPSGTLVGAVRFAKAWTDYRKQKVAAGVYTLRFASQPPLGDHAGTTPHPEFLLISPAAEDTKSDAIELKNLIGLSARTVGGSHPSVLLLFPNHRPAEKPALAAKAGGVVVLNCRRAVKAAGQTAFLGLGLTLAGQTAADINP
jgi:hypothetical protein